MKRFVRRESTRESRVNWPKDQETAVTQLFAPRKPYRKMIILIDWDTLQRMEAEGDPSSGAITPGRALAELIANDLVLTYRYADEGPSSSIAPSRELDNGTKLYQGWVTVESKSKDGVRSVVTPGESGWSLSGVIGNWDDVAANDFRTKAYQDLPVDEARRRRLADALAVQVATQGIEADLFITERTYAHNAEWLHREVIVATPLEALALLSLYLRAQGHFLITSRFSFNRGLFYWVGARELLPEGWRWFSACVQHSHSKGQDDLLLLGGSLLARFDRALQARDRIHIALNQPQNNDLRDEALTNLDIVLMFLMGAVDVAAGVAHRALGFPPDKQYLAAWQDAKKKGWLEQVRAKVPKLSRLVDPGSPHERTLTILRLLRNSVHGAALQGLAVVHGASPEETLVGLPEKQESALLAAMAALGGRDQWGVKTTIPGRTHIDPGILVDRLFEHVIPLLNDLMRETPVEQLSGVKILRENLGPPSPKQSTDPFAPWIMKSIRWQLGFS